MIPTQINWIIKAVSMQFTESRFFWLPARSNGRSGMQIFCRRILYNFIGCPSLELLLIKSWYISTVAKLTISTIDTMSQSVNNYFFLHFTKYTHH
jgi:hypothetical protein